VYHHGVDPVTAFVLAGGKSSRMGLNQDKALFKIRKRTDMYGISLIEMIVLPTALQKILSAKIQII